MAKRSNTERAAPIARVDPESALRQAVAECRHSPLRFVLFAYPWGQPGTPLETFKGPDRWQVEELAWIGEQLEADPHKTIRDAMAAAHGVGKSAGLSWLLQWAMSTRSDTRAVATAGTFDQLRSKLIPEHAYWYQQLATRHWFDLRAESMRSVEPGHEDSWRLDFLTWSDQHPESFAGLHAAGRRIVFAMDEASQIPQVIFDTIEGALTDAGTEKLFLISSNTTRNTGPFFEAIEGKHRNRWHVRRIDGRESSLTDKAQIQEWIEAYGEDSDFVRVRVKARFPRAGDMQFISSELVREAMRREVPEEMRYILSAPLVFGLDVARGGNAASVLAKRRGRDARSAPWKRWRLDDLMQVAARAAAEVQAEKPAALFVDVTGMGAGVYDRLLQLGVQFECSLIAVNFGSRPHGYCPEGEPMLCANRRAEMWNNTRAWLRTGCIPDDQTLEADLTGVEYGFRENGAIILESKQDMVKRGLASPDDGDALALTFAEPVLHSPGATREPTFYDTGWSPFDSTYSTEQW